MRLQPTSRTFDIIVGFGGASTIPHIVASPIAKFVTKRVVDGYGPQDALTRSFVSDIDALKSSPVVYMTAGIAADGIRAISRMIGATAPPERVWGFDFLGCPTQACPGRPHFDTYGKMGTSFDNAKFRCLDCGWKSTRYRITDVPFIAQWDNAHPSVFSFDFPPAADNIAFWRSAKTA